MRVAVYEVRGELKLVDIQPGLEGLQGAVGGLLECVYDLELDGIDIWCDDEGK